MLMLLPLCAAGQLVQRGDTGDPNRWQNQEIVDKWNAGELGSIDAIVQRKAEVKAKIDPQNREALLQNAYEAMSRAGYFYKDHPDAAVDLSVVRGLIADVDPTSPEFGTAANTRRLVEAYFVLKMLSEGIPVSELTGENAEEYEFQKYKFVLESGNPELILGYFNFFGNIFMYHGYSEPLRRMRPLLEANMPESDIKSRLLSEYQIYERLEPGRQAPSFRLRNAHGSETALEDFRGKIVVIDSWASWCRACIAKFPDYVALAEKHKNRDDIIFITVLAEDYDYESWKDLLERVGVAGLTNLFAPEKDGYRIDYLTGRGFPMFIIDKDGTIISSKAPHPNRGLEEYIDEILSRDN